MIQTASNIGSCVASRTQSPPEFFRRSAGFLRDMDRWRAGAALSATFRLAGLSGKNAARVLEVHESTTSRYADGKHDTPQSRVKELYRKLTKGGAFPAPLLADLLADAWRENVSGKSTEELLEDKRRLHCEESREDAKVDVWQADDLAGNEPECEEAVDEAILGQIARLLELYTIRQEIRAREGRAG